MKDKEFLEKIAQPTMKANVAKWLADKAYSAGTTAADWTALLALLAPVAVGGAAGYASSKLTSPDSTDLRNVQKKLYSMELAEHRAELERRKAIDAKKGINPVKEEGRGLRL